MDAAKVDACETLRVVDVARVLEDEAENLDIAGHGLRSDLLDDDRNRLDG